MLPGASAFNQFSLLIFRHAAWRFLARPVLACQFSVMLPGASAFNQFSLLIFRHAAWRFLARPVMYLTYTPSRAHHASCLAKNSRR